MSLKTEYVKSFNIDCLQGYLSQVIDTLKRFYDSLNPEHRETASIYISVAFSDGEGSEPKAELYFQRPKTAKEQLQEQEALEQWEARKRELELEQLKILKKKYEGA